MGELCGCSPPTLEALSVTNPNKQSADGDRWRKTSGFLGIFADLFLGSVLVKASLSAQLYPLSTHPDPAEAATAVDDFVVINTLPRASHSKCLTLICTRVPPKKPQNQHNQWPASDNMRTGSN